MSERPEHVLTWRVEEMLTGIMLVICALVLLAGSLYVIPAMGKYLEKLAMWLSGFQGLIGIVAIIVAIVDWGSIAYSLTLLIVGLILAASIMSMLPAVGKSIARLTKYLGAFQVIIGIIALILGILALV